MNYFRLLSFLLLLCCSSLAMAQFGWVKNHENPALNQYFHSLTPTQDGGYYLLGDASILGSFGAHPVLFRLDADGDTIWRKEYPSLNGIYPHAVAELPNGGAIFIHDIYPNLAVAATTPTGALAWTQTYSGNPLSTFSSLTSCGLKKVSDGNFILHDTHGSIFKINPAGTVLWTTEAVEPFHYPNLSPHNHSIVELSPDSFIFVGGQEVFGTSGQFTMQGLLVGATGVLKRETLAPANFPGNAVIQTSDQALLFVGNGNNSTNDSLYLVKTDVNLNPIWTKKHLIDPFAIDVMDLVETPNGEVWCLAREDSGSPIGVFLYVFDASGNYLRKINVSNDLLTNTREYAAYDQFAMSISSGSPGATLELSTDGHVVLGISVYNFFGGFGTNNFSGLALVKLDSSGQTYPTLSGKTFADYNTDCTFNTGDASFEQVIVQATRVSDGRTYYTLSDTAGKYNLLVDTGTFTIQTSVPLPFYWQACPYPSVTFSGQAASTLDLGIEQIANCPLLQVDLSAPFLRATNGGSTYTIQVCNHGSAASPNTVVEVEFDSLLNVGNASVPILSQVGNTYTYDVGNVGVGACTSFTVQVVVDSTLITIETLCTEARVSPDSICLPNYWTGPVIEVDGACVNDTILFEIMNVGGNMTNALNYYVFEDHVMMRQGTFQLNTGSFTTISQPALAGKTYRISAQQPPGIPLLYDGPLVTKAISNCVPDSSSPSLANFINQFSNGHRQPFSAIDCQPAITAYDPNDKQAQPIGYQGQHYIDSTTILDYKIRFQNTGNDTAFYVMIKDTLSPYLDPSSIQMGASSHPLNWTLLNNNVLKVTFPNIQLVDSMTNEPLSHGFFTYSIRQQANNPIGTVINNRAAIYFDYNPPIITNTTFHTIGNDFIVTRLTTDQLYQENLQVKVYPNPFREMTTIEVEGKDYGVLTLQIYDVSGRLQQSLQVEGSSSLTLHRGQLVQGIYFYTLQGDGEPISSGKIVVQGQ